MGENRTKGRVGEKKGGREDVRTELARKCKKSVKMVYKHGTDFALTDSVKSVKLRR